MQLVELHRANLSGCVLVPFFVGLEGTDFLHVFLVLVAQIGLLLLELVLEFDESFLDWNVFKWSIDLVDLDSLPAEDWLVRVDWDQLLLE